VDCSQNSFSEGELKTLVAALVKNASSIESLDLHECGISDANAGVVSDLLKALTKMGDLSLCWNNLTAKGIAGIAWKHSASLKELYLAGNHNISDEGVSAMISSGLLTSLTTLDLGDCGISAKGALALSSCLGSSSLTELSLGLNKLGDEGVKSLALALPSTKLCHIDFTSCNLSDLGAGALALAMYSCTSLTELRVGHNDLTDVAGLAFIQASKQCVGMVLIELDDTNVSEELKEELYKILAANESMASE